MKYLLSLIGTAGAHAQCVMCQRTAAAQQWERAQVLNAGIFVLLAPPLLLLGAIAFLAYKKNQTGH